MKHPHQWTRRHTNGAIATVTRFRDGAAYGIAVWPAGEVAAVALRFRFPDLIAAQETADLLAHPGCIDDCDPWGPDQLLAASETGVLLPSGELVFLTRPMCAKAAPLRANLEAALGQVGWFNSYSVVNQDSLPADDGRIGYGTPTVLYRGRDLFGLPAPMPPFPQPT